MCEQCGVVSKNYGLEGQSRRWCGGCAREHGGVLMNKPKPGRPPKDARPRGSSTTGSMCEDCGIVSKNYGLPVPRPEQCRRWCGSCAVKHGGVLLHKYNAMGSEKYFAYAAAKEERQTARGTQGKHAAVGSKSGVSERCEDCGQVSRNYGHAENGIRRYAKQASIQRRYTYGVRVCERLKLQLLC
eukprot:SAG11_NODE_2917_length_2839_cov_1.643431_3_plen_185_part_00